MKARISEARPIVDILNTAKQFVEEVTITATPESIKISQMDTPKISLVRAEIKKEAFTEYDAETEEEFTIPLENTTKTLRKKEMLEIETERGMFTLRTISSKGEVEYRTNQLQAIKQEDPEEIPTDTTIEVDAKILYNAVRNISATEAGTATIIIRPSKEAVYITNQFSNPKRKSETLLTPEQETKNDKPVIQKIETEKGVLNHYIASQLESALKNIKGYARIEMGKSTPILITDLEDKYHLNVLLTPRLED